MRHGGIAEAETARLQSMHTLFLNAAPTAVGFYEKLGWEPFVFDPDFGFEDLAREPGHVREPGHIAPTGPGGAMTDVDATAYCVFGGVHRGANLAPAGCPFSRDVGHG